MGRDIRVESKHFIYHGSKSSDLLMAFDLFLAHFPRRDIEDSIYFDANFSRKEFGQVLKFVKENDSFFKDQESLLEKLDNIYARLTPKDSVEVSIW